MADRYQGRPFRADDEYDRTHNETSHEQGESDPLAELARLIGQTDPFSNFGRHGQELHGHGQGPAQHDDEHDQAKPDFEMNPGPPSWMQRVAQREAPLSNYTEPPRAEPNYYADEHAAAPKSHNYPPPRYEETYNQQHDQQLDPTRYDDALYGVTDDHAHAPRYQQQAPLYPHDAYAQEYGDDLAEPLPKPRRGGMVTVVVVLSLAFIGTAAAYAYRTFTGAPRTGEAPIIRADTGPNKIVPLAQPGDGSGKLIQDRLGAGPASERIVSREEQPVDVNAANSAARVVFPPPTNAATPANQSQRSTANSTASGNFAGDEPRRVRTLSIRPDQADTAPSMTATRPAGAAASASSTARAASPPATLTPAANAPVSLAPQAQAAAPIRTASNAPATASEVAGSSGGYVVQISSRRSEAEAQASYRALQSKFSGVLGAQPSLIKRADLGEKGIYYRAMVGPFGTSDEASQLCSSLKSAGGQCVVQRN